MAGDVFPTHTVVGYEDEDDDDDESDGDDGDDKDTDEDDDEEEELNKSELKERGGVSGAGVLGKVGKL
ncbi:hypothetical protein RUND412_000560 [Rhizina undulata]